MIGVFLLATMQLTEQQQARTDIPTAEFAYNVCTFAKAIEYEGAQKGESAATVAEAALGGCPKELSNLNSLWFRATAYRDAEKVSREIASIKADARQSALSLILELRAKHAASK